VKRYVTVGVRVKSDIRSPEFKIVSIGFPKSSLIGQTGLANNLVYKLGSGFFFDFLFYRRRLSNASSLPNHFFTKFPDSAWPGTQPVLGLVRDFIDHSLPSLRF
jgi:hypothetical protein